MMVLIQSAAPKRKKKTDIFKTCLKKRKRSCPITAHTDKLSPKKKEGQIELFLIEEIISVLKIIKIIQKQNT